MRGILERLQRTVEGGWDIYSNQNIRETCHTQVSLEMNESALFEHDKGSPYLSPSRDIGGMESLGLTWISRMTSLSPVQFKLVFGPACSVSSTLGPNRRPKSKLGSFIRGKKHCLAVDISAWSFSLELQGRPGQ